MKDVTAQVGTIELINHNVYQVTLKVENLDFIAGQYLMIVLPSGEMVPYSIGSAPHELPELTLYILVNDDASLAYKVIDFLMSHTDITIKMPGGDSHIEAPLITPNVDHILLIAGGTGFSQIKSLYDHLKYQNYSGKVSFYWGLRTPEDVFQKEWLKVMSDTDNGFSINVVVNEPNDSWGGRTGWLYQAIQEDFTDLSQSVAFISGSVAMVYGTLDQLQASGLHDAQCTSDVFAYAPRN
ncbi:NAD(P)H-flavin reductase [Marinomonas sp. 15G1-11]|uniref:NAD(P)H-flavin reductase n=1 Tax=Marinomonas phaeophyticola TaxID=3004091 RepID=A0ABT4JRL1_9GAMM|nr:NAD(P)H-flavin reductase [Marinomonas sp. 15G1-11]MCZ2720999.1 NAD(P)H-flavin reductase [Marinomonas sp. 15G1-11]